MVRPISQQPIPTITPPNSDVTSMRQSASLLSRSTLSSYSGYCQSISDCFGNVWQWIKTHIFCCFSKASQESSETTQTSETTEICPIPIRTEGKPIDIELNQAIHALHAVKIQNHPEWDYFPSTLAFFFHRIQQEFDFTQFNADENPLDQLNYMDRIKDEPLFRKVNDALELQYPHRIYEDHIEEANFELNRAFMNCHLTLLMKAAAVKKELEAQQRTEEE